MTAGRLEVRRGAEPDELLLVRADGRVLIIRGYGVTSDEARRTTTEALELLRDALGRGAP